MVINRKVFIFVAVVHGMFAFILLRMYRSFKYKDVKGLSGTDNKNRYILHFYSNIFMNEYPTLTTLLFFVQLSEKREAGRE